MALCPVDSGDEDGINHKRHSFLKVGVGGTDNKRIGNPTYNKNNYNIHNNIGLIAGPTPFLALLIYERI